MIPHKIFQSVCGTALIMNRPAPKVSMDDLGDAHTPAAPRYGAQLWCARACVHDAPPLGPRSSRGAAFAARRAPHINSLSPVFED